MDLNDFDPKSDRQQQHRGGHYNDNDEEVHHGHPSGPGVQWKHSLDSGRQSRLWMEPIIPDNVDGVDIKDFNP